MDPIYKEKSTENHVLIVIGAEGESICTYDQEKTVLEVLIGSEIAIPIHCGGRGACGNCKIRVEGNPITRHTPVEVNHLPDAQLKEGIRLACQVKPQQNLHIRLINVPKEIQWNY